MKVPLPLESTAHLSRLRESLKKDYLYSRFVSVCGDTGCSVHGSHQLKDLFTWWINEKGLSSQIGVKSTGCLGLCECGPVVIIHPEEIFYQQVTPEDVKEIVEETLLKGVTLERLLYRDPHTGGTVLRAGEIPFYRQQVRNLLGNNWRLDPTSIYDYLAHDGYSGLGRVLQGMSSAAVVEEIKNSGLRGRGGAGFPTGSKWEEAHHSASPVKYIICNADEGDPGAFMDRSLLEGNPHSVLEGMILGGYAIGAREGIIYIREEYPSAMEKVVGAIQQAEEVGLLGEDILGSGFSFRVRVSMGAGAFVCGETSALVNSIEGKVGEPRQKPPHLAEKGLYGYPTVVNNVETLANVSFILQAGVESYLQLGSHQSPGTKIFSLVGKVRHTGLVEVPLGLPLREIIYGIGGGIKEGGSLKAVQTGGPSGGCIPQHLLEVPTDFEDLDQIGSMMGSGGMIVMDQETCMVDFAKYFLNFLCYESCGKCFSCREGLDRMLELVEGFTRGEGTLEELDLLKELADTVKNTSMCGLGKTAANPVLSTIRYFEEEYRAHIQQKRCPAGVCQPLIRFYVEESLCNGCGSCRRKCPAEAITGEKKELHHIEASRCTKCGICWEICPTGAVVKE